MEAKAKTYNGHNGIDIDVPNFRWMDGGVSNVLTAASGVVTGVRDTEPARNTSCTGSANFVQVRQADGLTALYGLWNRQLSPTPGVWTVSIFVNDVQVQTATVIAA